MASSSLNISKVLNMILSAVSCKWHESQHLNLTFILLQTFSCCIAALLAATPAPVAAIDCDTASLILQCSPRSVAHHYICYEWKCKHDVAIQNVNTSLQSLAPASIASWLSQLKLSAVLHSSHHTKSWWLPVSFSVEQVGHVDEIIVMTMLFNYGTVVDISCCLRLISSQMSITHAGAFSQQHHKFATAVLEARSLAPSMFT